MCVLTEMPPEKQGAESHVPENRRGMFVAVTGSESREVPEYRFVVRIPRSS
jgi:hypothetical protein